jgi:hypothetical protein
MFLVEAMAAAPAPAQASTTARFVIGIILISLGCILALNIGNISAILHENSSGFTPWRQRRERWRGPNPFRLVGFVFVIGGIAALVSAIVSAS